MRAQDEGVSGDGLLFRSYRLHSHDVKWGGGSGQQSVTAVSSPDDPNSLWVVKGGFGEDHCAQGTPVRNGQLVRLTHLQTQTNLHSHRVRHSNPSSRTNASSRQKPGASSRANASPPHLPHAPTHLRTCSTTESQVP